MTRFGTILALAALAGGTAWAQGESYGTAYPNKYPPPLPEREGPGPPTLVLEWIGEVPFPGPARPGALHVEDGRVVVANGDRRFSIEPTPGGAVEPAGPPQAPVAEREPTWVYAPDRKMRFAAIPERGIVAEARRGGESERWKRAWRLRRVGSVPFPPLLLGERLFFASSDDRIYAVRAKNGHRLWATDVGDRLSRELSLWEATVPRFGRGKEPDREETIHLLLAVPDGGAALLVLDVHDGRILARGTIPEGKGRLVSAPLVLEAGKIAAVRQGFALEDAALGLFRIASPAATPGPDASGKGVPYNGAASPGENPSRR